jgi:ADP-ribose pyrophosphatase YjhB (NUDIX family)
MTTIERTPALPDAPGRRPAPAPPPATLVVPVVSVVVRWRGGRLLLVRRRDEGIWELPGGPVRVGETAIAAAVRASAEEAGVQVLVTGVAGLCTDPSVLVRSAAGDVHQQFTVLLHARAVGGSAHGDLRGTSEAAWVAVADIAGLPMSASGRRTVAQALAVGDPPFLG